MNNKTVFDAYGKYYDLFYKDKNYRSESEHVESIIKKIIPGAKTILDLGCGTGQHCIFLGGKGFDVTGVEISETMVDKARTNLSDADSELNVRFTKGDIRDVSLNEKYDVIVSLFHVMSYQTTNEDFLKTLKTVRSHLADGGKFIFDFWYGPAVLKQRPESRVKTLSDNEFEVERRASPDHNINENVVDVNYKVFVRPRSGGEQEISETHSMRYFFLPEIKLFLESSGMKFIDSFEWMTGVPLTDDTWNALVIAEKN